MILNIYGPSGSGKTTLIRSLLKYKETKKFFEEFSGQNLEIETNKKISASLIPLPKFRGSVKELFEIFPIENNSLISLNTELESLFQSIFYELPNNKNVDKILSRQVETFSAGEIRRLYILKSLLVESNILILDEPFSNSDKKLWNMIYRSINIKKYSIILSHFSLIDFFDENHQNISIPISEIRSRFYIKND